MRRLMAVSRNARLPAAACLLLALLARAAALEGGPAYSLAAEASAGFAVAADGLDPASADSAAIWLLGADFLHRIEAPGWGVVVSHNLDLSGQASSSPSFQPAVTIHEAYARLDLSEGAQLFVGKRRMGLGLGTTFAPGDLIDPRTGFWDQKSGFAGLDAALSLGADLSLRAAMSLDRNFAAYAAGLAAKRASAAAGAAPADQSALAAQAAAKGAYAAALAGAAGPADPRLCLWALSFDAQLGALELAAAAVYSPDYCARPSLGFSLDAGGLIVQAEGAVELEGGECRLFGTAGLRYAWSGTSSTLAASLDYDYNGGPGRLLAREHYLLPFLSYSRPESFSAYARALVELESPSALLSAGLTLYPAPDFDLELSLLAGLGGGEFDALGETLSPGAGALANSLRLLARAHF